MQQENHRTAYRINSTYGRICHLVYSALLAVGDAAVTLFFKGVFFKVFLFK